LSRLLDDRPDDTSPSDLPPNESGDAYFSLGGKYRLAYELYDQVDMGISNIHGQDAPQNRVVLLLLYLGLDLEDRPFEQRGAVSLNVWILRITSGTGPG